MIKLCLTLASLYGLLGVILGAFGAHALRQRLSEDLLRAWQTGVEYQFYHALALLGVVSARLGQADARTATVRTIIGGVLALLVTYGIGAALGVAVG